VLGRLYTNTIEYFQGKVLYADHNIFVVALQRITTTYLSSDVN